MLEQLKPAGQSAKGQSHRGNDEVDPLAELFGMLDELFSQEDSRLCGCGTKKDAFEVALKLTKEMLENDCPLWAMQVATAMHLIRVHIAKGLTLTSNEHPVLKSTMLHFDLEMLKTMKGNKDTLKKVIGMMDIVSQASREQGAKDLGLASELEAWKDASK